MTDFDYDVMQKKRIASGAFHKKGGSKSKKCTLPSDHLTEAQKRKLNGPVTSVNMNQPIVWADYKALSDSLKKSYLINLLNTYKPSSRMLARMFGTAINTVTAELRRLGLPVAKPGQRKSKACNEMWANFLAGGANYIISEQNDQIEAADDRIEEPAKVVLDDEPTLVDALEAAEDRAAERLVDLMEQGGTQYDEEAKTQYEAYYDAAMDSIEKFVAAADAAAKTAEPEDEDDTCEDPDSDCLSAIAARYEGNTKSVRRELANLLNLFGDAKIKVKLSVEVMP